MKLFKKALLIYTGVLILFTYTLGWGDLIGNKQLTGDVVKDVWKSLSYYITDVIIYWWPIIIIGAIVLTAITILVNRLYIPLVRRKKK